MGHQRVRVRVRVGGPCMSRSYDSVTYSTSRLRNAVRLAASLLINQPLHFSRLLGSSVKGLMPCIRVIFSEGAAGCHHFLFLIWKALTRIHYSRAAFRRWHGGRVGRPEPARLFGLKTALHRPLVSRAGDGGHSLRLEHMSARCARKAFACMAGARLTRTTLLARRGLVKSHSTRIARC